MNRGKIFRSRFDTGMDRLQDTASQVETKVRDQARVIASEARGRLVKGRDALTYLEHAVADNMRTNRSLYLVAGVALVGLLVAKMVLDRRHVPEQ